MKINYRSYFLGDKCSLKYTLDFTNKNVVVHSNTFDALQQDNSLWTIVYNFKNNTYQRLKLNDDEVISTGKIVGGYVKSNMDTNTNFLKFDKYNGIDCIQVKQTFSYSAQYVTILTNDIVSKYIDNEHIDKLHISSMKMLGRKYDGYGIVCEKKVEVMSGKEHCVFKIDNITDYK